MRHENLLGQPEVRLPEHPQARAALASAALAPAADLLAVAAAYPAYCGAWAALAERAMAGGDVVVGYAFARTGYHRGLDQLRRAGWHGHGPIPWEHQPNQGFLRALRALQAAAEAIGEQDEAARCRAFLAEASPAAAAPGT